MDRRSLLTAALAGLLGARLLPFAVAPALAQERRRAVRLRRRRRPRPRRRRRALRPAADGDGAALRRPEVRRLPRHPLPRGPPALRRRQPRLPDGAAAARPPLPGPDRDQPRRRRRPGAAGRLLDRLLRLPPRLLPLPRRPRAGRPRRGHGLLAACASATRSTAPASGTRSRCSRARATSAPSPTTRSSASRPAASPSAPPAPEPEEFPIFKRFWVHEPQPGDRALRLQALLDSESVAGAFDFAHRARRRRPRCAIEAVLFPRREIAAVGIAPLTSMYYFGPESRADVDDFRDAVHDSDGLRIVNGYGERLWRPLRNPARRRDLGLQRREPARLRPDPAGPRLRALLRRRGALRAAPLGLGRARGRLGTGRGDARRAPSADEFTDNIVAFWRPAEPLAAGSELRYAYRLSFGADAARGRAARPRRRHPQRPLDPRRPRAGLRRRLRPRHDRLHDRGPAARGQRRRGQGPVDRSGCPTATSPASASTSSPASAAEAEFRLWLDARRPGRLRDLALPLERVRVRGR